MLKKYTLSSRALVFPFLMLVGMWGGFLLQHLGVLTYCDGAIIPLSPEGLKGVLFSPFLHGNMEHLLSNTLPMAVLLFLLYQFYGTIAHRILLYGWMAAGLLVWSFPPVDVGTGAFYYSCIVGASGLIYVLAFFLFFSGVFRWDVRLLAVTLVVGLYYGGLVWGVFPEEFFYRLDSPSRVSWQSHLSGAVVGVILAFLFRKSGAKRKKFIWEFPEYYSEKDDRLWQRYKEMHPDDFQELPQKRKEGVWEHLEELRRKDG
ncbi:rhomboid family intramembrane serine protease [Bergeyella sp. RCAD1439]|uniref:rhomboid family intramembrane serine protease n=1 Tax=Bergeyella anatis TaxID=3113737 RepID=UPI002E19A83B|nr:rhomboid family intramembrane serine protease [Bergeyella sp. RCAD1439]